MISAANAFQLGKKELWSLVREPMLLVLIIYAFTAAIYIAATAEPETLNRVPIAIVDEDDSPLSNRIASAFYPPHFLSPQWISIDEMDRGMDSGKFTFVIDIPPDFQADVLAGKRPSVQLNVDATRMSQAFTGSGAVQQIVLSEVNEFVHRYRSDASLPVVIEQRMRFNPTLEGSWMAGVLELINNITMLSIILTGAALIREREHGTIEHLLTMPVTPTEIMLSKIGAMALVVLIVTAFSIVFVVQGALKVPMQGSVLLFLGVAALHLFSTTSMGIFLATLSRSMPQFSLLMILVILPLEMLSGGTTPRESMPEFVRSIMLFAPTTHFVAASNAILRRGAGLDVIWPQVLAIVAIASTLFGLALLRFRKAIGQMA